MFADPRPVPACSGIKFTDKNMKEGLPYTYSNKSLHNILFALFSRQLNTGHMPEANMVKSFAAWASDVMSERMASIKETPIIKNAKDFVAERKISGWNKTKCDRFSVEFYKQFNLHTEMSDWRNTFDAQVKPDEANFCFEKYTSDEYLLGQQPRPRVICAATWAHLGVIVWIQQLALEVAKRMFPQFVHSENS